jgi:hypothetical protein
MFPPFGGRYDLFDRNLKAVGKPVEGVDSRNVGTAIFQDEAMKYKPISDGRLEVFGPLGGKILNYKVTKDELVLSGGGVAVQETFRRVK